MIQLSLYKITDVILMYICVVTIYTLINYSYDGDWFIDLIFSCYTTLTIIAIIEIKIAKTRD